MEAALYPVEDGADLYLVAGMPFLYIPGKRALILSDTHFGFEEAAARGLSYGPRSGYTSIFLPRVQLRRALEYLRIALDNLDVEWVVVDGDLKHAFDRLLRQEREEITELANFLKSRGIKEVTVVRGNHDNFAARLLRDLGVDFVDALELSSKDSRILIVHGHVNVLGTYDYVIIGHEHPSIRCFDVHKFPALVEMPLRDGGKLIVIPATGPYHPGIAVALDPREYLSPIIRERALLDEMRIITWTELGMAAGYEPPGELGAGVKVEYVNVDDKLYGILDFESYSAYANICL